MRFPRPSLVAALASAAALGACASAGAPRPAAPPGVVSARPRAAAPETVGRGCPPERARDGEVRLVFLGDSGYGTGVSEWGTHGQEAIADRINRPGPPARPRLLPGRQHLLAGQRRAVQVALRRHVRPAHPRVPRPRRARQPRREGLPGGRGVRAVGELLPGAAHGAGRRPEGALSAPGHVRGGGDGARRVGGGAGHAGALASEAVSRRARPTASPATRARTRALDSGACNAADALAHAQFGFGSVEKGDPPEPASASATTRSSGRCPRPRPGAEAEPAEPEERPLVDVMVLDSNTLHVGRQRAGPDRAAARRPAADAVAAQRDVAVAAVEGKTTGAWKILGMHHPPRTPRAAPARSFGKCVGGHGDELALDAAAEAAFEGLDPPDIVMAAHNHIYARSHPARRRRQAR